MAKIGDNVRFLNDIGGGTIVRIENKIAYVRDPHDGFEIPMPLNELIILPANTPDYPDPKDSTTVESSAKPITPQKKSPIAPKSSAASFALLFEPQEIRRLSQTAFDIYIVNDSPYSIFYSVSSRNDSDSDWSLIEAGEAEPNLQIFIGERMQIDLNSLRNISVQIIAYSRNEPFNLMPPISFTTRLDLTRLAKLHCFTPTAYSSTPVLTIPILSNGSLAQSPDLSPLAKFHAEPPKQRPTTRNSAPANSPKTPKVVDLHIHELLDSTAGLQPADMLEYQLREFDRQMEAASKIPGSKIIFIHGKGEGVLRAAILDRLRKRWPRCEAQDASFREYGFGATQITIHK